MNIVGDNLGRYNGCSDSMEKRDMTNEIVTLVKASSGRFLTQESGVWVEASDDIARQKVSHAFRNIRMQQVPKGNGPQLKRTTNVAIIDASSPIISIPKRTKFQ
jgi:hypothetical protein